MDEIIQWIQKGKLGEVRKRIDQEPWIATERDGEDQTLLHVCCTMGWNDVAHHLVSLGGAIELNAVSKSGWTPLHCAANQGNVPLCVFLLKRGADPRQGSESGATFLHYLIRRTSENPDMLDACLEIAADCGMDINAPDNYGETPLHQAAFRSKLDNVRSLLRHGADPNRTTHFGESPLHFAARTGLLPLLELLLDAGASARIRGDRGLPSDVARDAQQPDAMARLEKAAAAEDRSALLPAPRSVKPGPLVSPPPNPASPNPASPNPASPAPESDRYVRELLNGPRLLPPRQRRIRHVEAVAGIHVVAREGGPLRLMNLCFSLHERSELAPFYVSEVCARSCSPVWRSIGTPDAAKFQVAKPSQCYSFVLKLWDVSQYGSKDPAAASGFLELPQWAPSAQAQGRWPGHSLREAGLEGLQAVELEALSGKRLVLEQAVDLYKLGYIGEELSRRPPLAAVDALVFRLHDGWYTAAPALLRLEVPKLGRTAPGTAAMNPNAGERRRGVSCGNEAVVRLIALREKIERASEKARGLQRVIQTAVGRDGGDARRMDGVSACEGRIAAKKAAVAAKTEALKARWAAVRAARGRMVPRVRELGAQQVEYLASRNTLATDLIGLQQTKRSLVKDVYQKLERRRWRMIGQLVTAYPIEPYPGKMKLTVGGILLPNGDFAGFDEESIATALGHVCHMVWLISRYLEVPLPFSLELLGSRSQIVDEISTPGVSLKYPLYYRGVDRTKFEVGVYLLNKNLEQLLHSQGLDAITLRSTLPNLLLLFTRGKFRSSHST